jgi:hypothetical protein
MNLIKIYYYLFQDDDRQREGICDLIEIISGYLQI